ncbi:hypothetical protein [Saccharothrix xinjiangensis]|uniref:Uncharacterized protein n=1 Tax=Saccharothrix xinjiangensis TaxID=204798 RepID=A0ABV9XYW0_9PSEU
MTLPAPFLNAPGATAPAAPAPAASTPAAPEPAVTTPVTPEPAVAAPAVVEPAVAAPAVVAPPVPAGHAAPAPAVPPAAAEPTPAGPTPAGPAAAEPVTPEPVTPEPVTPEPVTPEPVTPEPVTPEPVTSGPVTSEPVTSGPAAPAPATTDPATPVPTGTFAEAAKTDLDKANTALDAVDKQAVQLDLDRQGIEDLLKLVSQARALVDTVHTKAVSDLDIELKFGNNWVSEAISRRLREVAVGDESSAVNVIGDFMQVLFEVEETIRRAARNLQEADDDAADTFGSAGEAKG